MSSDNDRSQKETATSEIDFFQIAAELSHERATPDTAESQDGLKVGQYRIERSVGRGGFGEVFEAYDEVLLRKVALKKIETGREDKQREVILEEGRTLARLNHPGIVKVHTVETKEDAIYFVSEFIEGQTLGQAMGEREFSLIQSVEIVANIAEALDYAHNQKIVHLDLKPNNVILADGDFPILIDFGIAVSPQSRAAAFREFVGSPPFVSPEQARGETHLVDRRSDIYCLGIILFGLLTKQVPFEGHEEEIIARISSPKHPVPSLHKHLENCPRILERICSKATAKRPHERYPNAAAFAKNLRDFAGDYQHTAKGKESAFIPKISPKGLRAFDHSDQDYFIEMLPGIRDSHGIPESLRFWQSRIEVPSMSFRAGVIYGPSGCGKSSFVQAGLLPLLDSSISAVFVSAENDHLEEELLKKLRSLYGGVPGDLSLSKTIREIRERDFACETFKLVVVIDQFEQRFHSEDKERNRELLLAIRQCDGLKIQTVLCVRDDYWLDISHFMNEVGEPLSQSTNCAPVDLFERDHARRVLTLFGRAYGNFSSTTDELSQSENDFIETALDHLSQEGRFYPVHLSLFAELTKAMDWSKQTLHKLGGLQAVGVEFLHSSFSSRIAGQNFNFIEREARAILEAFLPGDSDELRRKRLSEEELGNLPPFPDQPLKLERTIRILDQELRLITSVEGRTDYDENEQGQKHERTFQLSHDYLVPSIREWIYSRKQRSHRGRAQIRLSELSRLYQHGHDRRYLPSSIEWLKIGFLTNSKSWTRGQRLLMHAKGRRLTLITLLIIGIAAGIFLFANKLSLEKSRRDSFSNYLDAPPSTAAILLPQQRRQYRLKEPEKLKLLHDTGLESGRWLNLALFLLPENRELAPDILTRALEGEASEIRFILRHLTPEHLNEGSIEGLWQKIADPKIPPSSILRCAAVLAGLSPDDDRWKKPGNDIAHILMGLPPSDLENWMHFFEGTSESLRPTLEDAFNSPGAGAKKIDVAGNSGEEGSVTAAIILGYFNQQDPIRMCQLLDDCNQDQLVHILDRLSKTVPFPEDEIRNRILPPTVHGANHIVQQEKNRAKALLALARHDMPQDFWRMMAENETPSGTLHLWVTQLAAKSGLHPRFFTDHLFEEENSRCISSILQILGDYPPERDSFRTSGLENHIVELFTTHSDALVHTSAKWLLNRWGWSNQQLFEIRESSKAGGSPEWYYAPSGTGMITPRVSVGKNAPAPFSISMTEVTARQYRKFDQNYRPLGVMAGSDDCPVHNISAQEAMKYCNWLSTREGIAAEELCYQPSGPSGSRYQPVVNYLEKTGYRMPTKQEFIQSATRWNSGNEFENLSVEGLASYAWFLDNSDGVIQSVGKLKPTGFGVFDAMGNLEEYCHGDSSDVIWFAGSNYRTASWALSLMKVQETTTDSGSIGITFRIAKTRR